MQVLDNLRAGVQARRKLLGPRTGIDNRPLSSVRDRELSADGRRDFNDPSIFGTA